jgi:hypothetical protein
MLKTWSVSLAMLAMLGAASTAQARQELWTLDNLKRIGGRPATPSGAPKVIDWAGGKAIEFDGAHDSVLIKGRPLVGVPRFSIEVIMRVDGGVEEQKFLHVAQTDPATGLDVRPVGDDHDANHRIMFELRAKPGGYYLDAVLNGTAGKPILVTPEKLNPYGRWQNVAQTFDGTTYRTWVDGVLQGEMPAGFAPQGAGNVRIGARMEELAHFKGAIARIRFTDRALAPYEMLSAAVAPVRR